MNFKFRRQVRLLVFLALSAACALAALGAANAVSALISLGQSSMPGYPSSLQTERLTSDWRINLAGAIARTTAIVKSNDLSFAAYLASEVSVATKLNTELIKKLEALLDTDEERQLFSQIAVVRDTYHSSRDAVLRLKASGNETEASRTLEEQYLPIAKHYQKLVGEFLRLEREQLDKAVTQDSAEMDNARWQQIIILAFLLLLFAGSFIWLRSAVGTGFSRSDGIGKKNAESVNRLVQEDPLSASDTAIPGQARQKSPTNGSESQRDWNDFYEFLA